jgi:site-specific DNA recombinase
MPQEEVAKQFGQVLQTITMDEEVLSWVVAALKEGHSEKQKYHEERTNALHAKYEKLTKRLEAMYLDKLDGRIDQVFYDRKSSEWKNEQDDILRTIERHQTANRAYFDEGIKILELSQYAVVLYEKQNMQEKRKILNFLLSNSTWKDVRLQPNYRQPFDMLSETNITYQKEKALFPKKKGLFEFWLPSTDSNRGPSG